jgi:phasin
MASPPRKPTAKSKHPAETPALAFAEAPAEASAAVAETAAAPVAEPDHVPAPAAEYAPVAEPAPVVEPAPAPVAEPAPVTAQAPAPTAHTAAEAGGALEGSFGIASKSLQAFSAKALEAYQANTAASVEYVQALAGVRSVSDAIALQSEHMRKQYESLSSQAKELTVLAQQVAADAASPLKDQFGKAFKSH